MVNKKSKVICNRCIGPGLMLLCSGWLFSAVLSAQPPASSPAIMIQIKCTSGTAERWQAEFEKEILPSIQEAISKSDGITKFSYFETVLPGQPFDFVLLFEVKSLGALDTKRPFPHYAALFRRVGAARGEQILHEMGQWEHEVKVVIVRSH